MLKKGELDKIVQAIRNAENRTSAEIRVCIAKRCSIDPLEAAYEKFLKMEMDKTALRNAVLIYVAPNDSKASIIGDVSINEVCGEGFWDSTLDGMINVFKTQRDICGGICYAVEKVGELVKQFFPVSTDDINELSDEVLIDED